MFTHTLRSAHLALSSSSVADLVEQQKATKRLSQVLVARDTHRKTTVLSKNVAGQVLETRHLSNH
jgi:hypothetical protein